MFTLHILKFKLTGKLAVYKTVSATKLILKLNLFCLLAMNIQFYVFFLIINLKHSFGKVCLFTEAVSTQN